MKILAEKCRIIRVYVKAKTKLTVGACMLEHANITLSRQVKKSTRTVRS